MWTLVPHLQNSAEKPRRVWLGWASPHKEKGLRFHSLSGPVPGVQASPAWGAEEKQPIDVSHITVSLSLFLPLSLKIN